MSTILHATAGYFFLLLVVRVLSRRPGGQMTLGDFVLVFLMGGVIILSTVGGDRSVTNCTCAIITIGLLHRVVSWAKVKSPRIGAMVDGTPITVVRHGEQDEELMRGMQIGEADLHAAARLKGVLNIKDVDYAILERNGGISILKREGEKE